MDQEIDFKGRRNIELHKCPICNKTFETHDESLEYDLNISGFKFRITKGDRSWGIEACKDCIKLFETYAEALSGQFELRLKNPHNEVVYIKELSDHHNSILLKDELSGISGEFEQEEEDGNSE